MATKVNKGKSPKPVTEARTGAVLRKHYREIRRLWFKCSTGSESRRDMEFSASAICDVYADLFGIELRRWWQ
jgi:hypothetical protein